MSEPRIMGYGLNAQDLERSVAFYTEVLGMREQTRLGHGDVTEVILQCSDDPGDARLLLLNASSGVPMARGWGRGVIAVDDAAAVCERARAQGLRVKREPSPSRAGTGATIAVIEDPDGNPIEIVQLHEAEPV